MWGKSRPILCQPYCCSFWRGKQLAVVATPVSFPVATCVQHCGVADSHGPCIGCAARRGSQPRLHTILECLTVQMMVDFHACRWPGSELNSRDTSLAQLFDHMNDAPVAEVLAAAESNSVVITFSHFLPLQVMLQQPYVMATASYVRFECHVHH
jgi:hypothetical protein